MSWLMIETDEPATTLTVGLQAVAEIGVEGEGGLSKRGL